MGREGRHRAGGLVDSVSVGRGDVRARLVRDGGLRGGVSVVASVSKGRVAWQDGF